MSVKERIAAIRLAEKVERNREYAEGIGVFVKVGIHGVISLSEPFEKKQRKGSNRVRERK